MTLRTAGLIAGVLGVILLAVGLIANAVKPATQASPSASLDTAVVVVTPEILAVSPDAVLTIATTGPYATHTARTQDIAAWTAGRDAIEITGISDWDSLTYGAPEPVESSPSPTPSGSGSASPSPSATPAKSPASTGTSASASPSPGASASPSASPSPSVGPTPLGSQDIWRDTAQSEKTYRVDTADVPAGLALVVEALNSESITKASITIPRTIDDDWIMQLIWWGVGLTIVGLIALVALFIDVRPAQTKGEEWLAYRSGIGSGKGEAKPGSRRARREAGAAVPVAEIPAEPSTGSIPVVIEAEPETPAPMIAISRPPQAPPPAPFDEPVPPASAFQPPTHDEDEEEQS